MLPSSLSSFSIWTIKSLLLIIKDAKDNGRKPLGILREQYLSKGKAKVIYLYIELTSLRRLESESITGYIIRAEKMILNGFSPNFKPFTMVIIQKKKTLTFSEFKVCLRSYEETELMCYPPDKSNKVQNKF